MDIRDRKVSTEVSSSKRAVKTASLPQATSDMTERSPKPGRPRSQKTRKAIMAAVLSLLEREDYGDISIERIAAKAKVSKHSIYRWWASKGEVVLDAFLDYALERAAKVAPSSNIFVDLENFIVGAYRSWHDPLYSKGLRGLVIEMAFDPGLRQKFSETYLAQRRQLIRIIVQGGIDRGQLRADTDVETVIDVLFGFVWLHISFNAAGFDERRAARRFISLLRPSKQR